MTGREGSSPCVATCFTYNVFVRFRDENVVHRHSIKLCSKKNKVER